MDAIEDILKATPPAQSLSWVLDQTGPGTRLESVSWLPGGRSHANHALVVTDARGQQRELVLRRWARPGWRATDPDFGPDREITALGLLEAAGVSAPRLVAADVHATYCDVPALLETRAPGVPPTGCPEDLGRFCRELARPLPEIHAIDPHGHIPPYRPYVDVSQTAPPDWARARIWKHAWDLLLHPPTTEPASFIHRDYHPGNALWHGNTLTAIVDWTYASLGPPAVDVGHMRWNLVTAFGATAAERFRREVESLTGPCPDQAYWDIRTTVDLVGDTDQELPPQDLAALQAHVTKAVRELS